MDDFLATSVAYYSRRVACAAQSRKPRVRISVQDPRIQALRDPHALIKGDALYEDFRQFIAAARGFLHQAESVERQLRESKDAALVAALADQDAEIQRTARKIFESTSKAKETLASLPQGSTLPVDMLKALNSDILACEKSFAPKTSDAIPENLLNAAPDSKLYPALQKKVEALCGRTFESLHKREAQRSSESIQRGGFHKGYDEQLAEAQLKRLSSMRDPHTEFAESLSHADHLPVHERVVVNDANESVLVTSWNTLEFPKVAGVAEQVMDGIKAPCDVLAKLASSNTSEQRALLREALASTPAIEKHKERIVKFVQDRISKHGSDFVLLQEVSTDVQASLTALCKERGWASHFSKKNEDDKKCNAITTIISPHSFDEVAEVEVTRGKTRYFAAARWKSLWVVSCHYPLLDKPKVAEDFDGHFEPRILDEMWARFSVQSTGADRCAVLVGGDWNTSLRGTIEIAKSLPPEGSSSMELYTFRGASSLSDYATEGPVSPIDGIICVR